MSSLTRNVGLYTRAILFVLVIACLGTLLHTNRIRAASCLVALEETKLVDESPQLALLSVISAERSASTWLLNQVIAGGNPCALSLNAVFVHHTRQSGQVWSQYANMLEEGHVKSLSPAVLHDFLIRVAQQKCIDKLQYDTHNTCNNKCIVAFKEFDDHLSNAQHEYLWTHMNLTRVVLERNVKKRYESRWVASISNDWDTKGSYWHAKKKQKELVNILPSSYYCRKHHHHTSLCHFEKRHDKWYKFVRMAIPANERVEVSFNDTVLDDGGVARRKIRSALPVEFQDLLSPLEERQEPQIALMAVASMRRSASTSLLKNVLVRHNPCAVSLGDVFVNNTDKSEDAWLVEGRDLRGSIHSISPRLLEKFLVEVAKRKCRDRLVSDFEHKCRNKCIVGFKEFSEHLSKRQHEYLWKHAPNLTVVVLERDIQQRWKSRWIAAQTGDWDTTGSQQHKHFVKSVQAPPLNFSESREICRNHNYIWQHLCHFERNHVNWYAFLRETLPLEQRVEVSFSDAILDSGDKAYVKIASSLPQDFEYLMPLIAGGT